MPILQHHPIPLSSTRSISSCHQISTLRPLGVVLCISPWNFPLAIFIGQISAALVCGNAVIAKPAEQTSLIALKLIALLPSCGFPQALIQLVIGPGPNRQPLSDRRIQGVMFTGSSTTAALIAKQLYQRPAEQFVAPIPLIAETGGQNAMIADTSTLAEQLVDDLITSSFYSAGQRCSAVRIALSQRPLPITSSTLTRRHGRA